MSMNERRQRPNSIPWPPILLVLALVAGFALLAVTPPGWPLAFEPWLALQFVGAALIGVALGLDVWASMVFRARKTTVLPHRASSALVTSGPFSYSHNPIYVGNLLILAGVGVMAGSLWHVALVPVLAFAITHLAIRREEAHLSANFPAQWADYSSGVRRWL